MIRNLLTCLVLAIVVSGSDGLMAADYAWVILQGGIFTQAPQDSETRVIYKTKARRQGNTIEFGNGPAIFVELRQSVKAARDLVDYHNGSANDKSEYLYGEMSQREWRARNGGTPGNVNQEPPAQSSTRKSTQNAVQMPSAPGPGSSPSPNTPDQSKPPIIVKVFDKATGQEILKSRYVTYNEQAAREYYARVKATKGFTATWNAPGRASPLQNAETPYVNGEAYNATLLPGGQKPDAGTSKGNSTGGSRIEFNENATKMQRKMLLGCKFPMFKPPTSRRRTLTWKESVRLGSKRTRSCTRIGLPTFKPKSSTTNKTSRARVSSGVARMEQRLRWSMEMSDG